jgi:hypothetical protein
MPDPRDTDGVPVSGRADQGRDIAGIVLRRPNPIAGNLERRKPDPFASWGAIVIEIQPRMIHQDRKAAADQERHKKEIEEMAVSDPERKAVRPRKVVGIYLGNGRNARLPGNGDLDPGRRNDRDDRDTDSDQDRRANPNPEPAIGRVMDGPVCCIECDHKRRRPLANAARQPLEFPATTPAVTRPGFGLWAVSTAAPPPASLPQPILRHGRALPIARKPISQSLRERLQHLHWSDLRSPAIRCSELVSFQAYSTPS